jgi:hypothetical protein
MTLINQFLEPRRIANILHNYNGSWAIAGGWAIDLFLGFETRVHQDIEIAIPRSEQLMIRQYLKHWKFEFVEAGEFKSWKSGITLKMPIHEIHAYRNNSSLEILLNEIEDSFWTFRRDRRIRLESSKLFHKSSIGINYLAPEVVLIYKNKFKQPKDLFDLKQSIPKLSEEQLLWLKQANKSMSCDWEEWNNELAFEF